MSFQGWFWNKNNFNNNKRVLAKNIKGGHTPSPHPLLGLNWSLQWLGVDTKGNTYQCFQAIWLDPLD